MPTLLKFMFKYLNKKAQQNMNRQSDAYSRNFEEGDAFSENIIIDQDTRIKVPKGYKPPSAKTPTEQDIEEVEFEEID